MIYCFDTSAWLDCWRRWYPQTTFKTLWLNFDDLMTKGQIITPSEIVQELSVVEDGVADWIKKRPHAIFEPDMDVQTEVRNIMGRFRNFVELRGKSGGDPWVVATAIVTRAHVVTGERRTGPNETPRIPNVCDAFKIHSMNTKDFVCGHGWQF